MTLRQARELTGLSQTKIAAAVGVQKQMISLWETGRRRPSATHLALMLEAFHRAGLRITTAELEEPPATR